MIGSARSLLNRPIKSPRSIQLALSPEPPVYIIRSREGCCTGSLAPSWPCAPFNLGPGPRGRFNNDRSSRAASSRVSARVAGFTSASRKASYRLLRRSSEPRDREPLPLYSGRDRDRRGLWESARSAKTKGYHDGPGRWALVTVRRRRFVDLAG